MIATHLFGLALAPLFSAIAQVKSDRGATSPNVYQIRVLYVLDASRIVSDTRKSGEGVAAKRSLPLMFTLADRENPRMAETMMTAYWEKYGRRYIEKTGEPVTYEVLALIYNGGPDGWRKPLTIRYWQKVKAVMDKEAACAK